MDNDDDKILLRQGELFDPDRYSGDLLLTEEQLLNIQRDEDKGKYLAPRLKRKLPKTYNLVKACRAAGLSIRQTEKLCGVGYETVIAVDMAEKDYIAKAKEQMAKKCFGSASIMVDMLQDFLPKIAAKDALTVEELRALADTAGKLAITGNLLTGEATEILGTQTSEAGFKNWREWEKQNAKNNAIDV